MSNLEKFLNSAVKYGLYAILLTPLTFWPRALYGFMTPKFILFQVLVEIVFAAWLILKFLKPNFRSPTSRSPEVGLQEPKLGFRNWLVVALITFTAISFVSAIFGVDFSRSFWGIGARMTGLFAELHFFAWFLMLINLSKSDFRSPTSRSPEVGLQMPKSGFDMIQYLNFSFAVSILVAITGFFTVSEWHLVPGYTFFNNPTFAAPYFLFHFFWGLYQIYKSPRKFKPYFVVGSALILWMLILGQIRGAVLGFFAGVLFLVIGLIFSSVLKPRLRVAAAILCALAILMAILIWQLRESRFIEQSYISRFTRLSFTETTARIRLLTWQSALKGFKDRPIFGAGPENFNYVFNAHYNPRLLMFGGNSFAETWQDKPHNAFLQILTETGLIGSLFYALIWIAAVFTLFKLFKSDQKFISLTLTAAFISYLGLIFFSFDSFGSWFGLFLFLALLASQEVRLRGFLKSDFDIGNMRMPRIANIYSQLAALAILLAVLALLYVNYGIWRANIADADALRIFSRDQAQGIVYFKKSLSYFTPYKSEYQFDLIASVAGALVKNLPIPQLEDNLNFALDEANEAIKAHPKNSAYYTDMVKIYNILGEKGRNPEILNQAEIFGKKSLEFSSNRQETLFYLARTALLQENTKLAIELTKNAVIIDPVINISHWYLGLAYIADGQRAAGILEIKKALELSYIPQNKSEINFIKNLGL